MKLLASALAIFMAVVLWVPRGIAAQIETFGYVAASVGAERETGLPQGYHVGRAGARGSIEALGMLPFALQNLGLQGRAQYTGGQGSKFGLDVGPVYGWVGGKAGVFVNYQARTLRDSNYLWLTPAVALYYPQMNVNVSYTQPVSSPQQEVCADDKCTHFRKEDAKRLMVPTNRLQGTVSYFPTIDLGALNVLTGMVIGQCMPRHRNGEFLKFLRRIDREVPKGLGVHLILDNYGTHKHPNVIAWLEKHPRFHLHFTPTSSSWLNMVERWFGKLTDKAIRRGVFRSVPDLITAIEAYLQASNDAPRPFVWTATAEQIMEKVRRGRVALESTAG